MLVSEDKRLLLDLRQAEAGAASGDSAALDDDINCSVVCSRTPFKPLGFVQLAQGVECKIISFGGKSRLPLPPCSSDSGFLVTVQVGIFVPASLLSEVVPPSYTDRRVPV